MPLGKMGKLLNKRFITKLWIPRDFTCGNIQELCSTVVFFLGEL